MIVVAAKSITRSTDRSACNVRFDNRLNEWILSDVLIGAFSSPAPGRPGCEVLASQEAWG
jgi:hypothetical protein